MEEVPNPVVAAFAVHVEPVVALDVERLQRVAGPVGAAAQELVEGALPAVGVDPGGVCEHAVEVEEHRVVSLPGDIGLVLQIRHDGVKYTMASW